MFPMTDRRRSLLLAKATRGKGGVPDDYRELVGLSYGAKAYFLITGFRLRGSDTVRISFSANKACNVFGCYTSSSATDNYSLYASTASNAKYLRYGGETYNSYIPPTFVGERIDAVITPAGTRGMPVDSVITPETFDGSSDLCVGHTSPSGTSSKLDGNVWGAFVVDGRLKLIPVERKADGVLGYYDSKSGTFYEPIGSGITSLGYA